MKAVVLLTRGFRLNPPIAEILLGARQCWLYMPHRCQQQLGELDQYNQFRTVFGSSDSKFVTGAPTKLSGLPCYCLTRDRPLYKRWARERSPAFELSVLKNPTCDRVRPPNRENNWIALTCDYVCALRSAQRLLCASEIRCFVSALIATPSGRPLLAPGRPA